MLDPTTEEWLESRGISVETAVRHGLRTARPGVLAVPFCQDEQEVNAKLRKLPKSGFWWDQPGVPAPLWNVDVLDDPTLAQEPLVITEGEIDGLTAIECDFPRTVSVPNGAPATEEGAQAGEIDTRHLYLWNAREKLKKIPRFILATDDDAAGHRLREELIRRFLASRCSFVEYPLDCKDLNDVLVRHGRAAVQRVVRTARQCPVKGVFRLSAYPITGPLETFSSGWELLDPHLRLYPDELVVVTGVPSHGKTSFVLQLLANLAEKHGFRSAMFSPEMPVVPTIRDKLRAMRTRRGMSVEDVDAWIEEHFLFIGADPRGGFDDPDFTLEWLLEKANEAVWQGIRVFVIDPWNEVEHSRMRNESPHDYTGRALRCLKKFSRERHIIIVVIAHPTKLPRGEDGQPVLPGLYDISDSAHWFNKPDHGIVIARKQDLNEVHVAKVRLQPEAGVPGMVKMRYSATTCQFLPLEPLYTSVRAPLVT